MPYESHTNRELEFMLKKGKPLAHFCDYYPSEPSEEIIPELAFAPYVIQGTFVKREYIELLSGTHRPGDISIKGVRHVLYARANEAWRIDAFIAMKGAAAIVGWNIGFERLEGMLLGYEEWQSEEHLAKLKANDHTIEMVLAQGCEMTKEEIKRGQTPNQPMERTLSRCALQRRSSAR